jgi:hypothetical protein
MEIGTPRDSKVFVKKNIWSPKKGDNIYRILPPMGQLAESGKWHMYYSVVWGYRGEDGFNRPFKDVRVYNGKNKMVEVESAAHLRSQRLEAMMKEAKEANDEDLMVKIKMLKDNFNIDNKQYMNVMNLNGEIGVLKLSNKRFNLLKEIIKKVQAEEGIDPRSSQDGRFFNFFKAGDGQDTVFQVSVYEEIQDVGNGRRGKFPKVHALDDATISRFDSEAFDLAEMYPTVTVEQVEEMVKESEMLITLVGSLTKEQLAKKLSVGLKSVEKIFPSKKKAAPVVESEDDEFVEDDMDMAPAPKMEAKVEAPKEVKAEVPAPKAPVKAPVKAPAAKETKKLTAEEEAWLKGIGA